MFETLFWRTTHQRVFQLLSAVLSTHSVRAKRVLGSLAQLELIMSLVKMLLFKLLKLKVFSVAFVSVHFSSKQFSEENLVIICIASYICCYSNLPLCSQKKEKNNIL